MSGTLGRIPAKGVWPLPRLQVRTRERKIEYDIKIGRRILPTVGTEARSCLGKLAQRVVLISNRKVYSLYGSALTKSLNTSGFSVSPWLMDDGERHKSLRTAEKALHFLSDTGLERGDAVIALGGGVVGDLAGFVASTYLRGVALIQVPTTLLAQIDSSVGGKTGVNLPTGKNLVGSFHQPRAVIVDTETLITLPARELVAGWCETIKQGAVSSRKLFKQTTDFLQSLNSKGTLISSQLENLIASHCAFKASIVAADEREDIARRDHRSRRILNFGHTIAHALEAATSYRRFRHGEAVGHGMLVAGELSKNLGLLKQSEVELLTRAVRLCGPLPSASDLEASAISKAIAQDKKRAGGHIQWVLLEGIGRPRIVDGKDISPRLFRQSLRDGLRTRSRRKES
jgi:3-dehydroquinate synthase